MRVRWRFTVVFVVLAIGMIAGAGSAWAAGPAPGAQPNVAASPRGTSPGVWLAFAGLLVLLTLAGFAARAAKWSDAGRAGATPEIRRPRRRRAA